MAVMPPLDTATILVMSIVATTAMALALAVMRPRRSEGLGLWALALVVYAITHGLVLMRGAMPLTLNIVLSNTLMSLALALLLCAIAQFQAQPAPRLTAALPVVATAALMFASIDSYHARLLFAGVIWAAQLALTVRALWRPRAPNQRRGALLISAALGFQCVLLLARALWFMVNPLPFTDFMHGDDTGKLALVSSLAALVMASLGFGW